MSILDSRFGEAYRGGSDLRTAGAPHTNRRVYRQNVERSASSESSIVGDQRAAREPVSALDLIDAQVAPGLRAARRDFL